MSLVRRITIAVQKQDGDGLYAGLTKLPRRLAYLVFIERNADFPIRLHAFSHPYAQPAWDDRLRHLYEQIVEVVSDFALDLEQVAESGSRQQAGQRTFALDDGIGHQRCGVNDCIARSAGAVRTQTIDALQNRPLSPVGRSEDLVDVQRPVAVHHGEIGECSTDVHPQ